MAEGSMVVSVEKVVKHLKDPRVKAAVKVKSEVLRIAENFLKNEGYIELLPTILSTVTDPLNHDVYEVMVNYNGLSYRLTQSMIFHKQLALLAFDKIFITSPNIRLETFDKSTSGRHLFEFVQIDLEAREATREDIMDLIERLFVEIFKGVRETCKEELEFLDVGPEIPQPPFKKVKYLDAVKEYGEKFEDKLSMDLDQPAWLIDIPILEREFYDKLSPDGETLLDMDLILPRGYGEVISGGEREYEYDSILRRMAIKGNDPEDFEWYLKIVKEYGIPPSAGCGFGVERLTRYICGLDHVKYTRLFPKVPGELWV